MAARTLPWDWYPGTIPANAEVHETAYVETTFSFHLFRSERPAGVRVTAREQVVTWSLAGSTIARFS